MINLKKLTIIDGLMYALDDIKATQTPEIWDAFSRYMEKKPFQYATTGEKCILAGDLQLYIRLRSNALKAHKLEPKK